MAKQASTQVYGGSATTAWQTLYALTTVGGVQALPLKVREVSIQVRDATANLYVATTRPVADGGTAAVPGVTTADFLLAFKLLPDTGSGGGYLLIRGGTRGINTTDIYLAANTNESATTCAFAALTTGV